MLLSPTFQTACGMSQDDLPLEEYILSQNCFWEMDILFPDMSGIAIITIGFTNSAFMDNV